MERPGARASLCSGYRAHFEQAPETSVLIAPGLRGGRLGPFQPIALNGEQEAAPILLKTDDCENAKRFISIPCSALRLPLSLPRYLPFGVRLATTPPRD